MNVCPIILVKEKKKKEPAAGPNLPLLHARGYSHASLQLFYLQTLEKEKTASSSEPELHSRSTSVPFQFESASVKHLEPSPQILRAIFFTFHCTENNRIKFENVS